MSQTRLMTCILLSGKSGTKFVCCSILCNSFHYCFHCAPPWLCESRRPAGRRKLMTYNLVSLQDHICLVPNVNSLISTFGDGRPMILCPEVGQWILEMVRWNELDNKCDRVIKTSCGHCLNEERNICYFESSLVAKRELGHINMCYISYFIKNMLDLSM